MISLSPKPGESNAAVPIITELEFGIEAPSRIGFPPKYTDVLTPGELGVMLGVLTVTAALAGCNWRVPRNKPRTRSLDVR
jgi:hypothetical protein